jgi:hypothetical protein
MLLVLDAVSDNAPADVVLVIVAFAFTVKAVVSVKLPASLTVIVAAVPALIVAALKPLLTRQLKVKILKQHI